MHWRDHASKRHNLAKMSAEATALEGIHRCRGMQLPIMEGGSTAQVSQLSEVGVFLGEFLRDYTSVKLEYRVGSAFGHGQGFLKLDL